MVKVKEKVVKLSAVMLMGAMLMFGVSHIVSANGSVSQSQQEATDDTKQEMTDTELDQELVAAVLEVDKLMQRLGLTEDPELIATKQKLVVLEQRLAETRRNLFEVRKKLAEVEQKAVRLEKELADNKQRIVELEKMQDTSAGEV